MYPASWLLNFLPVYPTATPCSSVCLQSEIVHYARQRIPLFTGPCLPPQSPLLLHRHLSTPHPPPPQPFFPHHLHLPSPTPSSSNIFLPSPLSMPFISFYQLSPPTHHFHLHSCFLSYHPPPPLSPPTPSPSTLQSGYHVYLPATRRPLS